MKPTVTGPIYKLSKDELIRELSNRNQPTDGNRDELRARLLGLVRVESKIVSDNSSDESEEDEAKEEPSRMEPVKPLAENVALMDTVRKWGCQFDGKDGVAFLEKLEDLRDSYGFTQEQLRRCLPLLFKDQALLWYRNNKEACTSWDEFEECFRQYYVPTKTKFEMEEAIARRRQKPNETAREYVTEIQTLMRRHGHMTSEDKLERTYHNLRPEYHLFIRRRDFGNLAELLRFADEYERTRRYEKEYQPAQKNKETQRTDLATVVPAYNARECCWGCGQRGHTRRFCRRPPKMFCSQCGKEGVLTKNCHGLRPGNGAEAEGTGGTARPANSEGGTN